MVLDDVAERADGVVEAAPVGDVEVLGHVDLHGGHVVPVPDRLEDLVREPQVHDVLDRLLPQEVVDAIHLILLEHAADAAVQLRRRRQVLAEGLLDHDARAGREAGGAERLDRGPEVGTGDREVEHRTLRPAESVRDLRVELGVGDVAGHVPQAIGQSPEDRLVHRFAGFLDRRARARVDLLLPAFPPADPEHRARQEILASRRYSAGNVILRARSPVIPKRTSASAVRSIRSRDEDGSGG